MPDFNAKMHQNRFRPPDPLAGFKGPTSKGRGGEGVKEGEGGKGGERKGG